MTKICLITGKKTIIGNKISNSNKKTKRKFYPNLQKHKFWLPDRNIFIKLRVTAKALRIIDKIGITNILINKT
jgi:large subunit ribosomal protein L28